MKKRVGFYERNKTSKTLIGPFLFLLTSFADSYYRWVGSYPCPTLTSHTFKGTCSFEESCEMYRVTPHEAYSLHFVVHSTFGI